MNDKEIYENLDAINQDLDSIANEISKENEKVNNFEFNVEPAPVETPADTFEFVSEPAPAVSEESVEEVAPVTNLGNEDINEISMPTITENVSEVKPAEKSSYVKQTALIVFLIFLLAFLIGALVYFLITL